MRINLFDVKLNSTSNKSSRICPDVKTELDGAFIIIEITADESYHLCLATLQKAQLPNLRTVE